MAKIITSLDSSLLKESEYDTDSKTLVLTFMGGQKYEYENFEAKDHDEFITSSSKGTHFGKNIRGKFNFKKI